MNLRESLYGPYWFQEDESYWHVLISPLALTWSSHLLFVVLREMPQQPWLAFGTDIHATAHRGEVQSFRFSSSTIIRSKLEFVQYKDPKLTDLSSKACRTQKRTALLICLSCTFCANKHMLASLHAIIANTIKQRLLVSSSLRQWAC